MAKDTMSRKWQLTINNPLQYNFNHEEIKKALETLTTIEFWCLCDEIGLAEQTPHTHIFIYSGKGIRFTTVKNKFKEAHIECCKGSCEQNIDYIKKEGRYANDPKTATNLKETYESFGEIPQERQGARNDLNDLYDMIAGGMSNAQILADSPQYLLQIDKIDRVRQSILSEKWRTVWRDIKCTYIYGKTGTGKTRGIMETYGYENVYRVTDYANPFDSYKCQDVILFDEFRSSLKIENMLKYLEGYPIELPSRYCPKQACFTRVYIVSNIELNAQYPKIQIEQHETWNAFMRRIQNIECYENENNIVKQTLAEYTKRYKQGNLPF
ncbi:MAG: replication protein [Clostridia bacterium]